jgi:hypothetical protein
VNVVGLRGLRTSLKGCKGDQEEDLCSWDLLQLTRSNYRITSSLSRVGINLVNGMEMKNPEWWWAGVQRQRKGTETFGWLCRSPTRSKTGRTAWDNVGVKPGVVGA